MALIKDGRGLLFLKLTSKQEYIDQTNSNSSKEREIIPPVAYKVPCRLYRYQRRIYMIPGLK